MQFKISCFEVKKLGEDHRQCGQNIIIGKENINSHRVQKGQLPPLIPEDIRNALKLQARFPVPGDI